ncbi:MAG: putative glutathione peroxidase BsaA [Acidobacteriota bacterium]
MTRRNAAIIIIPVIVAIAGTTFWFGRPNRAGDKPPRAVVASIYDVVANDIDGNPVSLDRYRGKTLLIVNVASKCRFTPQYEGLQRLYDKYQSRGLVILGFPANNFAWREPGTDAEIKDFCTSKYNVTFPIFSKISVAGDDIHPLYRYLTDEKVNPQLGGKVTWNFNKYLVAPDGKPVAHFASELVPESPEIVGAIESALP